MSDAGVSLMLRTVLCLALYGVTALIVWLLMSTPDMTERVASVLNRVVDSTLTMAIVATTYFFGTSKGSTDKAALLAPSAGQQP